MKKIFGLFAAVFLCLPVFCGAQTGNIGDVVVNEIAWMGGVNSANDEWVELKNMTSKDVDLAGWSLVSADGKLKIKLKGFIIADGYFLMERTDDNSVPDVPADMLYTGALSNAGQYLKLYDASQNLIDQVNFAQKWPAGNNTTKQTMEKTTAGWQTSLGVGGTPKSRNSSGSISKPQLPIDQKTEAVNPTPTTNPPVGGPTPTATYPEGVVINEILPAPDGDDATNEWVEIYNSTAAAVDISGWKLQDTQGTPASYTFPTATTLAGNRYLVLKRPETKITLNNDQDGLQLLFPDGKITSTVSLASALVGQSYNNTPTDWQWSTTLTPGAANSITKPIAKVVATKKTTLPTAKKPDTKAYVAAISQAATPENAGANDTTSPWPLFLGALGVVIISAIIILLMKFKNLNIEKLFKN